MKLVSFKSYECYEELSIYYMEVWTFIPTDTTASQIKNR